MMTVEEAMRLMKVSSLKDLAITLGVKPSAASNWKSKGKVSAPVECEIRERVRQYRMDRGDQRSELLEETSDLSPGEEEQVLRYIQALKVIRPPK